MTLHKEALGSLGEKELRDWLDAEDRTFAILSAARGATRSQDNAASGDLRQEIVAAGYPDKAIRRLRGQWFDEQTKAWKAEPSYIVLGMSKQDAIRMGERFNQDAIIFKDTDGSVGMYWLKDNKHIDLPSVDGQPVYGSAAVDIAPRKPKPEKRGPPHPEDLWSKSRDISFNVKYDWDNLVTKPWDDDEDDIVVTAQQLEEDVEVEPYREPEDVPEDPRRMPEVKDLPTAPPPERDHGLAATDLAPDGGYNNIMNIMRLATPEEVDYWANWYPIAHREAKQLASDYGISLETAAGVIAVVSPGTKWEVNLALAEQIIQNHSQLAQIMAESWTENLDEMQVSETGSRTAKPGSGAEFLKKPDLRPAHGTAVKNPVFLQKALNILDADDPMIGSIMGVRGPKVEVFYHSMVDPQNTSRDIVLDGHAINIWRGATDQTLTGTMVNETERQKMMEDYRRVADAYGIEPQEVQAITWSLWRGLKKHPRRPGTRMNLMGALLHNDIDVSVFKVMAALNDMTLSAVFDLADGGSRRLAFAPAIAAGARWLLTSPQGWMLLASAYPMLRDMWQKFESGDATMDDAMEVAMRLGADVMDTYRRQARRATRLRFTDEMAAEGEVDLADIRAGDRVRFLAGLNEPGMPHVNAGALGAVTEVHHGARLMSVQAMASDDAGDVRVRTVVVRPDDVMMVMHSGDNRLGNYRVGTTTADVNGHVRLVEA